MFWTKLFFQNITWLSTPACICQQLRHCGLQRESLCISQGFSMQNKGFSVYCCCQPWDPSSDVAGLQYIPRNMHTVFALLCFVVVIHWLIFPYPSGLLHWHCGNLTIAPVPAKQPWWIWINTSCEFIMNDCITTTKQSTTKPCAYFLGYIVFQKETGSVLWLVMIRISKFLYFRK